MRTEYFITMDTHCRTTDACVKTSSGKLIRRQHMATTLPALTTFIRSIPQPRHLCFEEGPLAGWLYRNLRQEAQHVIVCDPRRNAYIGKDGDKDDAIDAEKLNDLFRAKLIRPVHQNDSAERAAFKQLVAAYHSSVSRRMNLANRLIGLAKRWGLLWNTDLLLAADAQKELKERIARAPAPESVQMIVELWVQDVQRVAQSEAALRQRLIKIASGDELIGRLMQLPGYGVIRSATLVACLDTPWRFKNRSALYKYCGIGLRRERSGQGPEYLKVEQQCSRTLRAVVIGAAESVILQISKQTKACGKDPQPPDQENTEQSLRPWASRYFRWIRQGVSARNARRSLARALTLAAWMMWKNQTVYDPASICGQQRG